MITVWVRPVLLLGLLLLSSPVWAAPPVPVTACGQTLRGPASYYLPGDLACAPSTNLVLDSATLDLRGFGLQCTQRLPCLTLQGHGARVRNGTIVGWMLEALVLEGGGPPRVEDPTPGGLDAPVMIRSNANRLSRLTLTRSFVHPALAIAGNDNRVD